MLGVEAHSLTKRAEHAWDLLVGKQAGKGNTAVIIDGHMQAFDARAAIAKGCDLQ
jgi:hypothetical protein